MADEINVKIIDEEAIIINITEEIPIGIVITKEAEQVTTKIIEAEPINIRIVEDTPINIMINEGVSSPLSNIFNPEDGGLRIRKIYVKNGKLQIKYEDGE